MHAVKVFDQEPPTWSKLTAPTLDSGFGIRKMRQEQSGIDDVGGCTRERHCDHVVSFEPGSGDTDPGTGDEHFGRIDTDSRLGSEYLVKEFGAEAWSAAEVDEHLRGRERIGSEERARNSIVGRRYELKPFRSRLIDPEPVCIHVHIVAEGGL